MRSPIPWFLTAVIATGCAVSPERELPTGVTLLGSDSARCGGSLEVGTDPPVVVEPGNTVTLAVDDEDLDWACRAGTPQAGGDFACPAGTTHLRVIRNDGQDEFTLECFG